MVSLNFHSSNKWYNFFFIKTDFFFFVVVTGHHSSIQCHLTLSGDLASHRYPPPPMCLGQFFVGSGESLLLSSHPPLPLLKSIQFRCQNWYQSASDPRHQRNFLIAIPLLGRRGAIRNATFVLVDNRGCRYHHFDDGGGYDPFANWAHTSSGCVPQGLPQANPVESVHTFQCHNWCLQKFTEWSTECTELKILKPSFIVSDVILFRHDSNNGVKSLCLLHIDRHPQYSTVDFHFTLKVWIWIHR